VHAHAHAHAHAAPHEAPSAAAAGARFFAADADADAAVAASACALRCVEVRLKLPDVTPFELPRTLAPALRAALSARGARVHSLEAAVRPGCTLLSACAVVEGGGGDCGAVCESTSDDTAPAGGAAGLAAALLSSAAAPFFRAQRFSVVTRTQVAHCAGGAVTGVVAARPPPRLPPLRPLALCVAAPSRVAAAASAADGDGDGDAQSAPPAGGYRLLCRLHGQHVAAVSVAPPFAPPFAPFAAALPPLTAEGVALFEAVPADVTADVAAVAPARPRPVLLVRDAAVATEVASLGDRIDAMPPGPDADAASDAAECLIAALGYALRGAPAGEGAGGGGGEGGEGECPARLLSLSIDAALAYGWRATAAALLARVPREGLPGVTPLHCAVRCGRQDALAAVLAHAAFRDGRLGHAGSAAAGGGGATPLHLAAALPVNGVAVVAALAAADAGTPLAWFSARDASGATPAAAAAAARMPGGEALTAALAARLAAARAVATAACEAAAEAQGLCVPELIWEAALEALAVAPGDVAATARAVLHAALRATAPRGDEGDASWNEEDEEEEEEEDDDAAAAADAAACADVGPGGALARLRRRALSLARASVGWDEPSAEEVAFVAYMSRRNRLVVQTLALLHLVQQLALLTRCARLLRSAWLPNHPTYSIILQDGSGTPRDTHMLFHVATGAPLPVAELPRQQLLLGTYLFTAFVLLLRAPVACLMAYVSFAPSQRALFARRYEAGLSLACIVEMTGGMVLELGIWCLFGAVVAYPSNVALLHVFFNVLVHQHGPVRPQWNWTMWSWKAVTQLGLITLYPAIWRHTWGYNGAVWVQSAASLACVLRARGNDAAMRAAWRLERERAVSAKKLA
jgi:hypothetical protein